MGSETARQSEARQPVTTRVSNEIVRNSKKPQGQSLSALPCGFGAECASLPVCAANVAASAAAPEQPKSVVLRRSYTVISIYLKLADNFCVYPVSTPLLGDNTNSSLSASFESFSLRSVFCHDLPAANHSSNRYTHRDTPFASAESNCVCLARSQLACGPAACRAEMVTPMVCSKVFSRVGLLGNPSDGFFGKTIAVSCANFWAEVFISSCMDFWNDALDDFRVFATLDHMNSCMPYGCFRCV